MEVRVCHHRHPADEWGVAQVEEDHLVSEEARRQGRLGDSLDRWDQNLLVVDLEFFLSGFFDLAEFSVF